MPLPPTGTLTFVFTDVEGSTRLLRELRGGYGAVMAEHHRLLREAFSQHGGHEVDTPGDSFFAVFTHPQDAMVAAVAAQHSLGAHPWPSGVEVQVRIGVHTGPAELVGGRYVGLSVHRAARICAAGHGGQILISQATVAVLEADEVELREVELRDLGELRFRGFDRPVRIYQAVAPGLSYEYPPPRAAEPVSTRPPLASNADRERTVSALGEDAAGGRLTLQEFAERTDRAFAATTLAELEQLDLESSELTSEHPRQRPRRLTVVVFGDTERTGRWRLPRFSLACILVGNADLDFRQAELSGDVASITAIVLFGNIDLYVPEGVAVELGGIAVFGHRRERGRDVPPYPSIPRLRIRILSLVGTADVWRLPLGWATKRFDEAIAALERGEQSDPAPIE